MRLAYSGMKMDSKQVQKRWPNYAFRFYLGVEKEGRQSRRSQIYISVIVLKDILYIYLITPHP